MNTNALVVNDKRIRLLFNRDIGNIPECLGNLGDCEAELTIVDDGSILDLTPSTIKPIRIPFSRVDSEVKDSLISVYGYFDNVISISFEDCHNLEMFGGCNTDSLETTHSLFKNCINLETIINPISISNAENAMYMFYNCQKLRSVEFKNTSNLMNITCMFYNCKSLESITGLDTSSTTIFDYAFYNCIELQKIDIDTSKAMSLDYTFNACEKLEEIVNLHIGRLARSTKMLNGCRNLSKLTFAGDRMWYSFVLQIPSAKLGRLKEMLDSVPKCEGNVNLTLLVGPNPGNILFTGFDCRDDTTIKFNMATYQKLLEEENKLYGDN